MRAESSEPLQPREIDAERQRGRVSGVMAKAKDWPVSSGDGQDPLGVRKAARSDSESRNRRDPRRLPRQAKAAPISPSAKWCGAGRESEGPILLLMPGETREEGRGPALVACVHGGKCEGMTAVRSNHPIEKVRELQRTLFEAAKRHQSRRFHALHDRIYRGDV